MRTWKEELRHIIFDSNDRRSKGFDIILLIAILLSLLIVMLESVASIKEAYGWELFLVEWVLTVLFSIEYIARIISSQKPRGYVLSFFGLIDLLAILPTYLSLFVGGAQYLMVVRALRLVRVFRVLKLVRYTSAGSLLLRALRDSKAKIIVFLGAVLTLVTITGTIMYLIEGAHPDTEFTSIPKSIYWTIVTVTTVGYGDIAPQTFLGQLLASAIMIMGYGIIAVPTGIVSVEYHKLTQAPKVKRRCTNCEGLIVKENAKYCADCGHELSPPA